MKRFQAQDRYEPFQGIYIEANPPTLFVSTQQAMHLYLTAATTSPTSLG